MKRNTILLALAAVLSAAAFLPAQAQTIGSQPVQGKVTMEGSPFPNAQVVLTNADTGKTYKTKSEKSGDFSPMGVPYGNYQVEVTGDKGEKLFSEKTFIGGGTTISNSFLKIDIVKGVSVFEAGVLAVSKFIKE